MSISLIAAGRRGGHGRYFATLCTANLVVIHDMVISYTLP
jgi:hypothetical protein